MTQPSPASLARAREVLHECRDMLVANGMWNIAAYQTALALDAQIERDAALLIKYAVNIGGNGWPKPLVEDGRGEMDAIRVAYARAIREQRHE